MIGALNLFPVKGGVSEYYSPVAVLTGTKIDYEKDLKVPFGWHAQANNEPNPLNTNAPRTLGAIYLRPMKNKQGHELMDLNSGRKIAKCQSYQSPNDWQSY